MFDVQRHVSLGRVVSVAPSPDGKWIAVAVQRIDRDGKKYLADLWRVPLDGSPPRRLTHGEWNDRAPFFRRDGALGFCPTVPARTRRKTTTNAVRCGSSPRTAASPGR